MNGNGIDSSAQGRAAYEAPRVERLGFFHVETQNGCLFGKQWGGPD
jgi:hypothetical protein